MPKTATQPHLTLTSPDGSAQTFEVSPGGLTRIGYAKACQVRVEGSGVEPVHCEISKSGTGYLLRDLAADSHTTVNGQPVSTRTLMDGDSICVGGVEIRFNHTGSRRDEIGRMEFKRQRLGSKARAAAKPGSGRTRVVGRRAVNPDNAGSETDTAKVPVSTVEMRPVSGGLEALAAASARKAALREGRETRIWTSTGYPASMDGPSRRVVIARNCDASDEFSRAISGGYRQTAAVARLRLALDTIYRMSNLVLAEQDLDGLFATVVDVVMEALSPDRAFLVSGDDGELAVRVARPAVADPRAIDSAGPSLSLVRACMDENLAVITEDAQLDPRFNSHSSVQAQGIRSAMCVPLRAANRSHGAIYVDRVASAQAFSEPELDLMAAIGRQAGLAIERTRAHEATEQMFLSCVRALVSAIEAKDVYTSGHSERVASHAMSIAERLRLDSKTSDAVRLGALLHDIGKIGVPEAILTKPGKLTHEEFEVIKTHPARGAEILGAIQGIDLVVAAVRWHHEAVNGRGYPDRLHGSDIPMPARIVAVADAFDAMTSNRSYRRNMGVDEVVREFRRCAGTQFDGDVCEAIIGLLEAGTVLPSKDMSELGIDIRTRIYTRKGA